MLRLPSLSTLSAPPLCATQTLHHRRDHPCAKVRGSLPCPGPNRFACRRRSLCSRSPTRDATILHQGRHAFRNCPRCARLAAFVCPYMTIYQRLTWRFPLPRPHHANHEHTLVTPPPPHKAAMGIVVGAIGRTRRWTETQSLADFLHACSRTFARLGIGQFIQTPRRRRGRGVAQEIGFLASHA